MLKQSGPNSFNFLKRPVFLFCSVWIACLAVWFVFNHRGFFGYLNPWIISNINLKSLALNLVVTPLALASFLLLFWITGKKSLSLIGFDGQSVIPSSIYSLALGAGIINTLFLIAGALKLLYPGLVIFALFAGCFLALKEILGDKHFARFNRTSSPPVDYLALSAVFLAGLAVLYALISALTPPVSWDELSYHLAIPKLYAEDHAISILPGMIMHQCSAGMEMLWCAALLLKNDVAAKLISFTFFALLLLSVYFFGKHFFSKRTAVLSAAVIAAMPLLLFLGGAVNNDISTALFVFLATSLLLEAEEKGTTDYLKIAALFAGLSVQSKMLGLVPSVFILAAIFFISIRNKLRWNHCVVSLALFAALSSPVLVRNYLWSGNPFFPQLYSFFGGRGMDSSLAAKITEVELKTMGVERTALNFISLPYHLITKSDRFQYRPNYYVIPFLALFISGLLWKRRYSFKERYILLYALFFVSVWFFSGIQLWRFLLPVLPIFTLLVIGWWDQMSGMYAKTLLAAVISINFIPLMKTNVNNNLFELAALPSKEDPGAQPRERYLEKTLDQYITFGYINRELPVDSKILLFREMRGYYLNRRYIFGDPLNQNIINYGREGDLLGQLKYLGVTHIVIIENTFPCPVPGAQEVMEGFLIRSCTRLFSANNVALYKINYR